MISRPLSMSSAGMQPGGFELTAMAPAEAGAVRRFCLSTIAEAFGHGYCPEWHGDLDRLGTDHDDYAPQQGGAFVVARSGSRIVACGGMRPLTAKPALHSRFAARYRDPELIASLWRVYVEDDQRGTGIGSEITRHLELAAIEAGYRYCYLHTSSHRAASVAFWVGRGYQPFAFDADPDRTVHLDKFLPKRGE